jgi:choline dehydrogenase-like flavoprotein
MKSIIIVGSGIAGALFARQLLQTNNDCHITIFEAGPDFQTGDYRKWLDHLMAKTSPYRAFLDDPRTENENFGLRGSRLFVKGGTTNHWGGWSLRFKPEDFELKSRTGLGADWPITYKELSSYYTQAEFLLGIEGDSDNDDPPRYGEKFPFEAAPYTLNDMPIIKAFEKLGMAYSHIPMARSGDKCITTGTCRYCPVNARYNAAFDISELQKEYESKLDIRMESPVVKIEMDGKQQARGVSFFNKQTGITESMEGDSVVVCNGTVESAKLLLLSTHSDWKDGIGNDSGHVGRHLLGHPLVEAQGVRPGNPDKIEQELGFVTLASRHFDTPEYQREGKMLLARTGGSNTSLEREILANVSRAGINTKMESKMEFSFYSSFEQFESPENRINLGDKTDSWGLRTTKIDFGVNELTIKANQTHEQNLINVLKAADCTEDSIRTSFIKPDGAHATSTCRMSHSDTDGVVDKDLRVHGTDNLYVCSNAVYPNVTATNPTLTLGALAVRLAEHISNT